MDRKKLSTLKSTVCILRKSVVLIFLFVVFTLVLPTTANASPNDKPYVQHVNHDSELVTSTSSFVAATMPAELDLPWWWWLLIILVVVGGVWLLAARRRGEEE